MRYPAIAVDRAVVLITGGGRGIGRATAAAFAARGATVCVGDLDLPAAEEAAAEVGGVAFPLDVTSRTAFDACVSAVVDRFGRVDVLVNNAGVMPLGGFLEQSEAMDATTLEVNVRGLIHGLRAVLPDMIARGCGHVVNVASLAGKVPVPGLAVYNASKFAARGLSLAVRAEFADTGVSISAVLPTAVRTGLVAGVPLGRGLPTADVRAVARAIVRSVHTRRPEIVVPGWIGALDHVRPLVPSPIIRLVRRVVDDTRLLTSLDQEARRDYEQRVADQAAVRQISAAESDRA